MANKAAPEVKITLDRPRRLRFDLNAMIALEGALGISFFDREEQQAKAQAEGVVAKDPLFTLPGIRAMLWACLIHEDPELTVEQVGTLIHAGNMQQISSLLNRVWGLSMPEAEEDRPPVKNLPPG